MLYAVGDIHGMRDRLDELVRSLPLGSDDHLVFVGDYVDRGPDSFGVVEYLIELRKRHRCTFLLGNHESMFLSFLGWRGEQYFGAEAFLHNGGETTLRSYGYFEAKGKFRMPAAHEAFYKGLVLSHAEGEYLFIHAGLSRERLSLSDASYAVAHEHPRELLWQRATGELPHSLGVTVIYGHTPAPDFQVRWNLPYSIGIDTGCVYGGPLTAIRLPDETVFKAG
jgi:serine/threonine protein phosphatase 1